MDLPELFKEYLLSQKVPSSKVTVKNYLSDVRAFAKWFEDTFKTVFDPSAVSIRVIEDYIVQASTSARSGKRYLSSLRRFFAFLSETNRIRINPFQEAAATAEAAVKEDPWKIKEFKNFLFTQNASHLTIKNYIIDIHSFIKWYETTIGPLSSIKDVNPGILYEYRQRLVHNSNFAPRSVNRKLSSLRRFIAFAQGQMPDLEQTEIEVRESSKTGIKLESISQESAREERKSKVPPFRLLFPLIGLYSFIEEKAAEKIVRFVKTSNAPSVSFLTKSLHKLSVKGGIQIPIIRNVGKEFYAAHLVSTANYPFHKKAYHHLRFTRPNWYKRYHNYAFAHYFHFALLVVYASGVGFMLYQGIFAEPTRNKTFAAPAQPLKVYSFQGRLTDATDNPITTAKQVRFMVYNSSSASGAAELWEEVRTISPDTDGIFSVLLASATNGTNAADCGVMPPASPVTGACGIPQSLFRDNSQLFLGVTIGNDTELSPRQQIATVAYATNAEVLQGLPPITQAAAGTTNVVLALDSSGNLTIGGSANPIFSASGGTFTLTGQPLLLKTNASSNGNIQLVPDGLGKIDLERPLVNLSTAGNLSPGGVEINDKFSVLATESAVAAFVINNNTAGGDIFTASSSGTPKFTIQNDGTIVSGKYTSQNGVLYGTQTTGVVAQATTATSGFCLLSGASNPGWATCPGGADAYWNQQNGSLFANNSTVDFLAGGQSTGSAAFRITGQGNPFRGTISAASVSANTSFAGFVVDNKGVGDLIAASASGVPNFVVQNNGNVIVGLGGNGKLTAAVLDPYLVQNQKTTGTVSLTFQTMAASNGDFIYQNQSTELARLVQAGQFQLPITGSTGGILLGGDTQLFRGAASRLDLATGDSLNLVSGSLMTGGTTRIDSSGNGTFVGLTVTGSCTGCISGSNSPFQVLSGAIVPLNSTLDFAIGAQATASAKFAVLNINSGTPTASISATTTGTGLALGGDGSIQSLRNATLTLGGNTTGNITLAAGGTSIFTINSSGSIGTYLGTTFRPIADSDSNQFLRIANSAGTVFVDFDSTNKRVGIGSTTPISQLHVTRPLSFGANGKALAIFDQIENMDILTASAAGTPVFTITRAGGIGLGATTGVGTNTQCLIGGATAAWGTCGSGNSPFQELSGAIVPNNSTEDFLLGSQATLSAKFAVLNINSGTPIASVSATSTGTGLALGGDGTIQSLRNNTLTIGGATTGDIGFKPGGAAAPTLYVQTGGNVGIGTQAPGGILDVYSSAASARSIQISDASSNATSFNGVIWKSTSGVLFDYAKITAAYGSGYNNSSFKISVADSSRNMQDRLIIDVNGNVGLGTTTPISALHVTKPLAFGATGKALAIFDQIENMDILTASAAGTPVFTLTRAGGIGLGATAGVGTASQCLIGGATAAWGSCASGTTLSPFQQGAGIIFPNNSTSDFFIGGQATASAKFAVLNINSGTPTASVSATATGAGLALGGDGTIQSLRNNTLTIGGATTGDIGFKPGNASAPSLYLKTGGNVGIGTVSPSAPLEIANSNTDVVLLSLTPGTGVVSDTGYIQINGRAKFGYDGTRQSLDIMAPLDKVITFDTNSNTEGANERARFGLNGSFGLGTDNPLSELHVTRRLAAGVTGKALAIFDQIENMDILTASAAGTPVFTLTRAGGIGLGATTGVGTASQCLIGGATAAWGSCGTGTTGASIFQQGSGLIFPNNSTVDFAIGAQATTSAKFAVLNVNGTGPVTATISGNLIVMPTSGAGGNVGIGTTAPGAQLHINGSAPAIFLTENDNYRTVLGRKAGSDTASLILGNNGQNDIRFGNYSAGGWGRIYVNNTANYAVDSDGILAMSFSTTGNVGIGTITPSSALHVTRPLSYGTTGKALAIFDQIENQDILTASAAGTTIFSITNAGGIKLGTSVGTSGTCITGGATAAWGSCGGGGSSNWTLSTANGTLSPNNNTLDFLLGGIATSSAKFAVLNMNGTGPATASVSGSMIVMPTTGAGGNVGIGTTAPNARLHVIGDAILDAGVGSATNLKFFVSSAFGAGNIRNVLSGDANGTTMYALDNDATDGIHFRAVGGASDLVFIGAGASYLGEVGIGTSTPSDALDVENGNIRVGGNNYFYSAGSGNLIKALFNGPSDWLGIQSESSNLYSFSDKTAATNALGGATLAIKLNGDGTGGRVGIGSTRVVSLLQIGTKTSDSATAPTTITTANEYLHLGGQEYNTNGYWLIGFGYQVVANTYSPAYMGFQEINNAGQTYGDLIFGTRSVTTDTLPTERMRINNLGNVGIGTVGAPSNTAPWGDPKFQVFSDLGTSPVASFSGKTSAPAIFVTNEGVGDYIVASAAGVTKFRVRNNGDTFLGNYDGTNGSGKLYTSGVDPLYTIDGARYSTFSPSILGMKEEITGKVDLTYNGSLGAYAYTLDFNSFQKDSDLWVFSRIIDPDLSALSILLTPSSQAKTWYKTDPITRKITLFSDRPTEISYRMTGNRFDYKKWPTISDEYSITGIIAPPPAPPVGSGNADSQDNFFANTNIQLHNGIFQLIDNFDNSISKADAFSAAKIAQLTAGIINTQQTITNSLIAATATVGELTTSSLNVTADSLSIAGQSLKDYIIQTVSNSGFAINGSSGIVSPLASIDEIHTNTISPLAGPDITLKGNLDIKGSNNNTVARIDTNGNVYAEGNINARSASFSGQLSASSGRFDQASVSGSLTANSVNSGQITTNEASISGTLRAGKIIADDIEGLTARLDSLVSNSVDARQAQIATLAAQAVSSNQYSISSSSGQTDLIASILNTNNQTLNTNFLDVSNLSSDFATFRNGLIALGPTTLGQATILDSLSVGTNLTIGENSINLLGGDLEIQPLKQGGISFLAGLVHIDTEGNLAVGGNADFAKDVAVHGNLAANIISPLPGSDLNLSLPSPDTKYRILNSSSSAVLSINQTGDLVASGSGTFNKLNLNFASPVYAQDLTTATASGSAGTAFIKRGHTELTIENPNVTDKSLIYITPVGQNTQVYLLRQIANQPGIVDGSFSVGTSLPTPQDLQFNWIIVN